MIFYHFRLPLQKKTLKRLVYLLKDGSNYIREETTAGNITQTRFVRHKFGHSCWGAFFVLCNNAAPIPQYSYPNINAKRQKQKGIVSRLAWPVLMSHVASLLFKFVEDQKLQGNLPLPKSRRHEVMFVLQQMRNIDVNDACYEPFTEIDELNTEGQSLEILQKWKPTRRGKSTHKEHLLLLFPYLIECIRYCTAGGTFSDDSKSVKTDGILVRAESSAEISDEQEIGLKVLLVELFHQVSSELGLE